MITYFRIKAAISLISWPEHISSSTEYGSDRKLKAAYAPQPNPNPNKRPWTDPDPNFDWDYWMNLDSEGPPLKRPALPKESGQAHEYVHSEPSESDSSTDSESEYYLISYDSEDMHQFQKKLGPIAAPPKEYDQADRHQMRLEQQTNPGPSTDPDFDWSNPGHSNPGPPNLGPPNPSRHPRQRV
jgi:hypothetical protein